MLVDQFDEVNSALAACGHCQVPERGVRVRLGEAAAAAAREASRHKLTIVGTVTLPSMGLALADHVSLGQRRVLGAAIENAAQMGSQPLPAHHPGQVGAEPARNLAALRTAPA